MRILFAADVHPDPDSGAAGTEWQTIRALRALGHDVDEIWAADLGRRIRHGNLHYLLELPYRYRSVIGKRCDTSRYDVIHANQGHCYLAARRHHQARRPGVFVCRSHGLDDHMERVLKPWRGRLGVRGRSGAKALAGTALDRLLHRHDRLAYQEADGVLVSSSIDEAYLRDQMQVAPARIGRIAQAPAATFTASPALAMDGQRLKQLLHVGGFAYWKGVHAVAESLNRLDLRHQDWRMTWVCRLEEQAQVVQLLTPAARERVELVAWVSQQDLCRIYDQHGIFLAPSLFEGFGKVFLEAMARGMCVIGTHAGGMPDVIEEGRSGQLVGFHDPEAIVQRIEWLWANPEQAEAMSASAAMRANQYSWERVAMETVGFYQRLLASRNAGERRG